jgi:hypothetical protein
MTDRRVRMWYDAAGDRIEGIFINVPAASAKQQAIK